MIEIDVDPRKAVATLTALGERQLPFATMKALNELATGFQADERAVIQSSFTVRRPWVLQGVKIDRGDFATKEKLVARVHIDEQRDFFNKFEAGGVRVPQGNARSLAVPINVRRTKAQIIQKAQTPKSFNFHKGFSSRKSQWSILQGDRHTFLLQRPDGSGLILQRTRRPQLGPSRFGDRNLAGRRWGHDPALVVLWALRPVTRVPTLLHFYSTARASVLSRWQGTFEKWYLEALRTAR
jgi:hypothetical protein